MEKIADTVEAEEMRVFEPEEIMATDEMKPGDLVIVEEPHALSEAPDYEKTQNLGEFMSWITKKMNSLPPHSGKTTAGCERVIAHLKMLDREISKAISRDVDCKLDDQAVEKFRKEIRRMIKKLDKRHKEINDAYDADDEKFASEDAAFVKEADESSWKCPECGKVVIPGDAEHKMRHNVMAHGHEADDLNKTPSDKVASACECSIQKEANSEDTHDAIGDNCPTCKIKLWKAAEDLYECISCETVYKKSITKEAGTAKVQLIMNPFERAICGIITNGVISQGRNAEEIYTELKQQYKFSNRDELSIQQLLIDLGYPIARNFIGLPHDSNIEFSTQYNA